MPDHYNKEERKRKRAARKESRAHDRSARRTEGPVWLQKFRSKFGKNKPKKN